MKAVLVRQPFTGDHSRLMGPGLVYPIFNKPPMNLLYLATPVNLQGKHSVTVIDAAVMRYTIAQTVDKIFEEEPDVIGLMAYLPMLPEAKLLAEEIRKRDRNVHITVGGPIVEFYPKQILGWDEIDTIVLRDGELVFPALLDAVAAGQPFDDLPGVGFKRGGEQIITSPGSFCKDLDAIPFPDRTLTPYKMYNTFMCEAPYSTVLLTSRGCSFKCKFCHNANRREHNIFFRSAPNIVDEIEQILALGIRKIFVYDDSFCFSRQRVHEFCDEVLRRKLPKFSFSIKARIGQIEDDLLRRLKETGCTTLGFGLESGTDRVLKLMNKGLRIKESERALQLCREHGFISMGYFVLGFPGETLEEARKTVDFAVRIPLDIAQFYACTTFPGTTIFQEALEKGVFHDYWADYCSDPVNHNYFPGWNDPMTLEEKETLVRQAHNRFYTRPSKVLRLAQICNAPYRRMRAFKTGLQFLTGGIYRYN